MVPFVWYCLLIHFAVTMIDMLSRVTYFSYFTGSMIMIIGFISIAFQIYDFYGPNSSFIQTLPYNRKTVLFSKWIFQTLGIMILSGIMFLTVILVSTDEIKNSISLTSTELSLMMLNILVVFIIMAIALTDFIQASTLMIVKIQRKWLKIVAFIGVLMVFNAIVFSLVLPTMLETVSSDVKVYFIILSASGFGLMIVMKIVSYLLYQRIDITGNENQQMQVLNLYGGRT